MSVVDETQDRKCSKWIKRRTKNVSSGETQDRKYILMMEQNDEFMRNISV